VDSFEQPKTTPKAELGQKGLGRLWNKEEPTIRENSLVSKKVNRPVDVSSEEEEDPESEEFADEDNKRDDFLKELRDLIETHMNTPNPLSNISVEIKSSRMRHNGANSDCALIILEATIDQADKSKDYDLDNFPTFFETWKSQFETYIRKEEIDQKEFVFQMQGIFDKKNPLDIHFSKFCINLSWRN